MEAFDNKQTREVWKRLIIGADNATKVYTDAPKVTTPEVVASKGKDYTYTPAGKPRLYDVNGNKIAENGLDSCFDIAEDGFLTIWIT